jgi:nucleoside-diphosphate-sugar epimerase
MRTRSSRSTPARVLVVGGTGFIGRACVAALRSVGHDVVSASRSSAELRCDLCRDSMESLRAALSGVDLVVNAVGVKRATHEQSWEAAHLQSVRRLLQAMGGAGVRCLVHVTVAGLSSAHTDPYSATKLASEEAVRTAAGCSELQAYILRPAVVWGAGDDFSRNLAAGILHAPVFPTPTPAGALAVVHVEDVAAAVAAAAAELLGGAQRQRSPANADASDGMVRSVRAADVVGPEALPLSKLLSITARALGLGCVALPIPAVLMVPAAHVVERLMVDPPITSAQLGLLRRGVTGDLAQTRALLGGRGPRAYTAEGCAQAVDGLAKPLFGVSVRPLLRWESVVATLLAVLLGWLHGWCLTIATE